MLVDLRKISVMGEILMNAQKLDKIILETVRGMQPISPEYVWLEVGESLNLKSNPSKTEVIQRLEKMEEGNILQRIKLKSEEEKYTVAEK